MVAYLSKSDASEGFNQILDFLNGSSIKYALMVNPNIYVSCIKQFWNTIAIKQVNDITRLQALVDKKKVVVTEAAIRELLRLDDAEGKGFSGVEIPLFEGMLVDQEADKEGDADEHVEEVIAGDDAHGNDSAAHGEVPTITQEPSITSPTPPTPPPQPPQDLPSTSQVQHTPPQSPQLKRRVKKLEKRNKVRVLKLRRLQRVGTSQRVDTSDDTVTDDESNQGRMSAEMDKDAVVVLIDDKEEDTKVKEAKDETEPAEVQEVVDVVTTVKLITKVVTTADETVTAASAIISTAEPQVPAATLTAAPARVAAAPSRRRKGVVIQEPKEESTTSTIIPAETKSKDKGKGMLVEEPKPLKKKQQIEQDEQYARELHAELNKDIDWDEAIDHVKRKAKEDPANVAGFKMDYFKGMSYDDIRPIFEAKFNLNVAFLLKTKEHMEEEENRALQMINETSAEKATKRRKLNEEVEDLKRYLQIVPNEDDDVYTEATPLARKVPVVDYEIFEINNKPYYKIIRADGIHQLYISFLTLLKNFDREDLEALWSLVKERFSTSKPKNFFDDFLKGEELEATGIMWCADHYYYNHTANFVSREEVPTLKIYSRPNAKCYSAQTLSSSKFALSGFGSYPSLDNRGWTSSVLPLLVGCTVSLVASVSCSTTKGEKEEVVVGIVGPGYAVPLLVVIPFRSSFGLVIVLLGRVPISEDEAAEESRVDEPELDKLAPWKNWFLLGCSPEDYGFFDSCFGSESYGSDYFGFDFG
nr:xylulose kinase-1 [Tanacetum cinerariifolium]